jgi:transposase InsO family protein
MRITAQAHTLASTNLTGRRPHTNARAMSAALEDKIVRLRKSLDKAGYNAGAATIAAHLARDPDVTKVPALSTIWRILARRGFIVPQPHKRRRSAWKHFTAAQPNELSRADVTHWHLADGTEAEILNLLDDHSRLAIASLAQRSITGPDVMASFTAAFTHRGTQASVHTDNGAIFTATPRRGGSTALQVSLGELGISDISSRPYHPQTCGKVCFHQTVKKHLRALPTAHSIAELQTQLDEFSTYYNTIRPHRAVDRQTPLQAFDARPKAFPTGYLIPPHYRVRHDRIDAAGVITIRYNSRLHHIGLCKHRTGTKVTVLIDDLNIRVLHRDTGYVIRKLELDPTGDYQPRGVKCGNSPQSRITV